MQLFRLLFRGGDGRVRAGWRILLVLFGWFVGAVTLQPLAQRLRPQPFADAVDIVAIVLWTIGLVALVATRLDRRRLADLGLRLRRSWWADAATGLVVGLAVPALAFGAAVGLGWATVDGPAVPAGEVLAVALLVALVSNAGVAFFEELIFRGYVLTNAADGLRFGKAGRLGPLLGAWALSAAVFALFHANDIDGSLPRAGYFLLAGAFLALPFVLTGQLGFGIGIHVAFNFTNSRLLGIEPADAHVLALEPTAAAPDGGMRLLLSGAVVVGCLLAAGLVRWRHGRLRLRTELAGPAPHSPAGQASAPSVVR